MDRRSFLRNLGLVAGAGTVSMALGNIPLRAFSRSFMNIQAVNGKVIVLLQLSGGNDGLNTIIPFEDSLYYNARPSLGIRKEDVIKLNNLTGMHPSLQPFKALYDEAAAQKCKLKFVASYQDGKASVGLQHIPADSDFYHL